MGGHFNDLNNDEFFKEFEGFQKQMGLSPKRVFRSAFFVWLAAVVGGVAFWSFVIYVAVHFIGKFW